MDLLKRGKDKKKTFLVEQKNIVSSAQGKHLNVQMCLYSVKGCVFSWNNDYSQASCEGFVIYFNLLLLCKNVLNALAHIQVTNKNVLHTNYLWDYHSKKIAGPIRQIRLAFLLKYMRFGE